MKFHIRICNIQRVLEMPIKFYINSWGKPCIINSENQQWHLHHSQQKTMSNKAVIVLSQSKNEIQRGAEAVKDNWLDDVTNEQSGYFSAFLL